MGKEFYDLTCEELCELMCGKPEEDEDDRKGDTAVAAMILGIEEMPVMIVRR